MIWHTKSSGMIMVSVNISGMAGIDDIHSVYGIDCVGVIYIVWAV